MKFSHLKSHIGEVSDGTRDDVACALTIERLSKRVNIIVNAEHMHIIWGPMCCVVLSTHAYLLYIYIRAPRWGPLSYIYIYGKRKNHFEPRYLKFLPPL